MDGHRTLAIISSIVAVVALIAAGAFFWQSRTAQNKANQAEKDLIYYKNTNFAKEAELADFKRQKAEDDLAIARDQLTTLTANAAKVPDYLNAVDAVVDLIDGGPTATELSTVDAKVRALNDAAMTARWTEKGRPAINLEQLSWNNDIYDMLNTLTSRIRELLK